MTLNAMSDQIIKKNPKRFRHYLGMSEIGEPCWRMLWYRFRMVHQETMTLQSLLAIEDGYKQEDIMAERLRMVPGVMLETVDDKTKKQFSCRYLAGHFSGHLDGKISGILEAPKTEHVWENKSVNEKKFKQLRDLILDVGEKDALEKWDVVYYAQAQIYMHSFGLTRHYLTVSSPGGRNYTSCRTNYNGKVALSLLAKAESIIISDRPLPRNSENRSFYQCQWCRMKEICFDMLVPEVNCRTCAFSEPIITGPVASWHCHKKDIDFTGESKPCDLHLFLNTLVPFKAVDADSSGDTPNWIKYKVENDIFYNVNSQAKKIKSALNLTSMEIKEKEYFECIFPEPKNETLKTNKEDKEITKKLKGMI
jgi:hypothetical protein